MKLKGFSYAVVSALFFGCAGLFVKKGYSDEFSTVDLLMLQYIIASILLLFMCVVKYRYKLLPSKTLFRKLLILGVFGNTLMTVFYYQSFVYLDMAVATMLLFTYPAMVSIASLIFLKKKISKTKLFSIAGTFFGCLLVLGVFSGKLQTGSIPVVGILLALLSAAVYAFMNLYSERIVEDVPGMVITFYTTLFSLAVLFVINFNFVHKLPDLNAASISNAALLAFFCEIIPLTLLYEAIKHIGPISVSIISSLELPASAVTAFLFLGEKLALLQIVGIVLVILCVGILKKEPQVAST